MLKITNTMSGKKEFFKSRNPDMVTMYVCGITPYSDSHIGHGRVYVVFDVLYRLLAFLGYQVTYCRNFTDIDDKLLNKAELLYGDQQRYKEIADACIKQYHENMFALNCVSPDHEPRVTDHMPEIIAFIEQLILEDKAYEVNGDVYFHIASFPAYGKLSKHDVKDLRAGSRVDIDIHKKDPLDFALWKSEPEGTFWHSPWGYGRPGWHIECSALASYYLGDHIDIHGGGLDLVFPHHENEIAQSEALHKKNFANYWIHNGFVRINTEKMSKSIGNVLSLSTIFEQFDPMVIRFYYLNHSYRSPLDFSFDDIRASQKSYQRLCKLFSQCNDAQVNAMHGQVEKMQQFPLITQMLDFLIDDMNTVGMFGVLFESINTLANSSQELCAVKCFLQDVVGLTLEVIPEDTVVITPAMQALIGEREKARANKQWARADELRDQLSQLGVGVHDKKSD
ncbi:MAG: cysteine--tRNA ligase [Candidatus Dependentiae bacterium]|nr:cysteine--tRNA ligase [Candidatus Dependentiae bacterium]